MPAEPGDGGKACVQYPVTAGEQSGGGEQEAKPVSGQVEKVPGEEGKVVRRPEGRVLESEEGGGIAVVQ